MVAHIKCKSGALRPGAVDGTETTRTIGPNEEIFVSTKGSCDLDIDFRIIKYDEVGNTVVLGKADGAMVGHEGPGISPPMTPRRRRSPAVHKDEPVEIRPLSDMLNDRAKEAAV